MHHGCDENALALRRHVAAGSSADAQFRTVCGCGTQARERGSPTQLLAINDFHGQIEPYKSSSGQLEGGAAQLAGYFDAREAAAKLYTADTWRLGVGDLIGASPAVSGLLQDEPTLDILDTMKSSSRRWATTSSTRASPSCCACSMAATARSPATGLRSITFSTWLRTWCTKTLVNPSSRRMRSRMRAASRWASLAWCYEGTPRAS